MLSDRCAYNLIIEKLFLYLVDCNLSTEDNYFMTNPEGLIDIPISDENGDQCEDNITGDERWRFFKKYIL